MAKALLDVEVDGMMETLKAFQGLTADIRRQANGELRQAAGECAQGLVGALKASASGSGVPVAPRVARSVKVKSDRLPAVQIGGAMRVGIRGGSAGALVWGSEHGGRNFAVGKGAGYWIRPAVERFAKTGAVTAYKAAVAQIMRRYRLL